MDFKSSKEPKFSLTNDEFSFLINTTQMPREEIIKWYKGFYKDCPSGKLTKLQFFKLYKELFPADKSNKFCNLMVDHFDKKHSTKIGFKEFLIICSYTINANPRKRQQVNALEIIEYENHRMKRKEELFQGKIQVISAAVKDLYEINKIVENQV